MTPTKFPKSLFRFGYWRDTNNRKMITNNELFFAPYTSFSCNDEFNIKDDYELDVDLKKMRDSINDDQLNRLKILDPSKRKAIVDKVMSEENWKNEDVQRQSHQEFLRKLEQQFGVLCFTYELDNYTQWSTFSEFAIELDTDFLIKDGKPICSGDYVNYYDKANPPMTKPLTFSKEERVEEVNKVVYNLPSELYSDEKEYRLTKYINTGRSRKLYFDSKHLKSIYIGANNSEKVIEEIKRAASDRHPETKVFLQTLEGTKISGFNSI